MIKDTALSTKCRKSSFDVMRQLQRILTGSPLTVEINGESVFIYSIVSKKRVIPQTNSRQTESLPMVKGDGQQPDKHYQLNPKRPDSICPVVEISCAIGYKRLCNQYLCPAYFQTISKAA